MEFPELQYKWLPIMLVGPSVSAENALDFIRRTDIAFTSSFYSRYLTNDSLFNAEFSQMVWGSEVKWPEPDMNNALRLEWMKKNIFEENFAKHFEHVGHLEHLSSHFIGSSWIGGPNGPVWPDGSVWLSKNFGKYPSLTEVETDLAVIAKTFPWLTFDLFLWDNAEEEIISNPTHSWSVADGDWVRGSRSPFDRKQHYEILKRADERMHRRMQGLLSYHKGSRETTWTVKEIRSMWGDQIEEAKKRTWEYVNTLPEFAEEQTS